MRRWWMVVVMLCAVALGVASYFWFFSGSWMCGHVDSSVETLQAVASDTSTILELDDPRIELSTDRCTWTALVDGVVDSVLFDASDDAPSKVNVRLHGMRSDGHPPRGPIVVSMTSTGDVVAAAVRSEDGRLNWVFEPYVDGGMPATADEWVTAVTNAHDLETLSGLGGDS